AASLQIIADQLATAVVNARQFEAEQRRVARIATINRIGGLIASRLSLDDIFRTAVEAIHDQLHFAYVAAGAVDSDDPGMLVLLAQAGATEAHLPNDYRQSIHEGLVGAAARSRQQVLVNDIAGDPRYLALVQPETIRAELVVPIVSGDRLLGVLNIESRQR